MAECMLEPSGKWMCTARCRKQNRFVKSHTLPMVLLLLGACLCGCQQGSPDAGAIVFKKNCFGCHGGTTTQAFAAPLSGYLTGSNKHTEAEARRIIREGNGNMPPFGRRLSRQEL